ncbi:MAG: hypothetical protein QOH62_716 [Solirubrobacteraceae bacterium]|nr:hypothetical protein [Solirubrobacteraceae bacterium]
MSTALDVLRRALQEGAVDALAPGYARNAVLDASLPGGRRRHDGRAAIMAELARWWDGPGEDVSFEAELYPGGAALWTERDGARLRHYVHLSGDLIVRHWIYSARPRGGFGGNSGAVVERRDGLIVKHVVPLDGWMGRATRDIDGRSARLWLDGQMARFPDELDTAVERVEADGDGYRIHMRDIADRLLGDEQRLELADVHAVFGAAAAMHREFNGEDVPSAARLEDFLTITSPATAARETDEVDLPPKQIPAAWDAFALAAPADVAAGVAALVDDPAPLAAALARDGLTLIHGDLRDDNLGVLGSEVSLIDWDLAAMATPGVELVWFLLQDAWRTDATRQELVAAAFAAEGDLLDDRGLALGALASFCQYGWILGHSSVVHPDPRERAWAAAELAFWTPWVRLGLEAL